MELGCPHTNRPRKAKGLCGSCYNKSITYGHPEKREVHLASRRFYARGRPKDSAKQRNRVLKHRYGLTQKQYNQLLTLQNNCCAICKCEVTNYPYYVDHNHSTNEVRGLLCAKCNRDVATVENSDVIKIQQYLNNPHNALARLELLLRKDK